MLSLVAIATHKRITEISDMQPKLEDNSESVGGAEVYPTLYHIFPQVGLFWCTFCVVLTLSVI